MGNKVWITWEDHRRSRELARAFLCDYIFLKYEGSRVSRYIYLSWKTIILVIKRKPDLIFCQNPSIFLASLLCFLRPFFKYKLVVDRHSNFRFEELKSNHPKWILFHFLSHYSLRNADLTIVTNQHLKDIVEARGGIGCVLPDKLPTLAAQAKPDGNHRTVTFITTYSGDEPIFEVVDAARILGGEYHFNITGSYKRFGGKDKLINQLPPNVTLTGFLPDEDYERTLAESDAIIVITTAEYTLTCGAYEAVALEKPMILGNTKTIKEYFSKGAVYADPTPESLAACIETVCENLIDYRQQVSDLKDQLKSSWISQFESICQKLGIKSHSA